MAVTLQAEQGSCELISQVRARVQEIGSKGSWPFLAHSSELVGEREREIGSQGSWPFALSSEHIREKEILAHKALGLLLSAQGACERERY